MNRLTVKAKQADIQPIVGADVSLGGEGYAGERLTNMMGAPELSSQSSCDAYAVTCLVEPSASV